MGENPKLHPISIVLFIETKWASIARNYLVFSKNAIRKEKREVCVITLLANSSSTGAAGCAFAPLRYLYYNKAQQQQ